MTKFVTVWCDPNGNVYHWLIRPHCPPGPYFAVCTGLLRVMPTYGYKTRTRADRVRFGCQRCNELFMGALAAAPVKQEEMFNE